MEKSTVLGHLKRHREALHILVKELNSFDKAETYLFLAYKFRYCERTYSIVDPDSRHVFDILFELKSDDDDVIQFIEKYGSKMDIKKVTSFIMMPRS